MIRISAVSYLNTKPFIYGIYKSKLADKVELSLDIPAICAQKLQSGAADLVLAPVAVIPQLPQAYLVSDYCIGSVGAVKTVCLYSETPLAQIEQVYLDFHSKTSVALVQLLFQHYWKKSPVFLPALDGFEKQIKGKTAGLVIGDRTIGLDHSFKYVYDLGEAWMAWTGLPFVFAAWISTRPLSQDFIADFNKALHSGLEHLPELIKILPDIPGFHTEDYFRKNISYELDNAKWRGLNRFLSYLAGEEGYHMQRQVPEIAAKTIYEPYK
jgi:chorismate dehydratase